ncbi:MAG: DUF541 domain-containing protein [Pseudomonadales bacterium]|nr:DUF541 domain-containing protein [Pseudomonadales bacterium]
MNIKALTIAAMTLTFANSACAEDAGVERKISVSGVGHAAAAPDTAVINLGVETEAKTAEEALDQNSDRTRRLLTALKSLNVAERHIQTQAISLHAQYDHERKPGSNSATRRLRGYQATNLVTVRIPNLEQVGEAIDAAVDSGGNRIDGIRFEIADPTNVLSNARDAAWENAQAKASQLARLAGATLGDVLTIDSHDRSPGPVREMAFARGASDTVPVQGGQIQMSVQIQVSWALE